MRTKNSADYALGETRAALFARKGYQPARVVIQKGARYKFKTSGLPLCCFFCGYDRHVDVAHRRGVMAFPETALVSEINDLRNLIPLCPNHHREADSGMIDLAATETMGEHFGYFGFIPTPNFKRKRASSQRGCISLKKRVNLADVWVLRYMEDGEQRSFILGDVVNFPTKESVERIADAFRKTKKLVFPERQRKTEPILPSKIEVSESVQ